MKDPTQRFSGRVDDYVRYRPRYPDTLLPLLQQEIALTPEWLIADLGSGTGFSAEPFLRNGNRVIGIEPNPQMRAAAERALAHVPAFTSHAGLAENTRLATSSVDMVLAGQAFHWFDPIRARGEFRRILRNEGWTVLLWNRRKTDSTPFLRAYEEMLNTFGTDYQMVRHDRLGPEEIEHFFGQTVERRVMPCVQILDLEGLVGRLLSSSYTPVAGDPDREPMLAEIARIFDEYQQDDRVRFEYATEVYFGRLH
ncbi:MAG: class I SAM-dependent methyltransferase [Longimicrobiales bacterium]